MHRHPGAQPRNSNARLHGYYSSRRTASERYSLTRASSLAGTEAEIALLRVKLKSVLQHDPDNIRLILRAINTLGRLVNQRQNCLLGRPSAGSDHRKTSKEAEM
jgi:hypothetical protein